MKTATTNARSRAPSLETVRGNLVFERAKKELSQAALAEAAGLARQTISDIERGAANPTVDVLDRIVTVLGIGLDQLFVAKPSDQKLDASEIRRRRASAKPATPSRRSSFSTPSTKQQGDHREDSQQSAGAEWMTRNFRQRFSRCSWRFALIPINFP